MTRLVGAVAVLEGGRAVVAVLPTELAFLVSPGAGGGGFDAGRPAPGIDIVEGFAAAAMAALEDGGSFFLLGTSLLAPPRFSLSETTRFEGADGPMPDGKLDGGCEGREEDGRADEDGLRVAVREGTSRLLVASLPLVALVPPPPPSLLPLEELLSLRRPRLACSPPSPSTGFDGFFLAVAPVVVVRVVEDTLTTFEVVAVVAAALLLKSGAGSRTVFVDRGAVMPNPAAILNAPAPPPNNPGNPKPVETIGARAGDSPIFRILDSGESDPSALSIFPSSSNSTTCPSSLPSSSSSLSS